MSKKKSFSALLMQQNILSVLLLTVVVIVAWVGFSIYFSYSKTTLTPTDTQLIAPLNPRLDATLFDKIAVRRTWTSEELDNFSPSIQLPQVVVVPGAESSDTTETPVPTARPTTQPATSSASIATPAPSIAPAASIAPVPTP
jgi:hypothetical protein